MSTRPTKKPPAPMGVMVATGSLLLFASAMLLAGFIGSVAFWGLGSATPDNPFPWRYLLLFAPPAGIAVLLALGLARGSRIAFVAAVLASGAVLVNAAAGVTSRTDVSPLALLPSVFAIVVLISLLFSWKHFRVTGEGGK